MFDIECFSRLLVVWDHYGPKAAGPGPYGPGTGGPGPYSPGTAGPRP